MKIIIITWHYAKSMGYSENFLPRVLAELGHEVHLVSSDLQPDFPNYKEAYEPFIGPQKQAVGTEQVDNYTLHRLPHKRTNFGLKITGLHKLLKELNPDIVQCFGIPQMSTYQAALYCFFHRTPLFLEEHTHLSTLSSVVSIRQALNNALVKYFLGPFVAAVSVHCYAIAEDVEMVTKKYFGYPQRKLSVQSLGVDTTIFHPAVTQEDKQESKQLRKSLRFEDEEVVFIYSGRFSEDKSPLLLAKAIDYLVERGEKVRGLFIGSGSAQEVQEIENLGGCLVLPFMDVANLPKYYRAADVGVWPKQESTSQLDALACGIPIIVSHLVQAKERVDGVGLTYEEENYFDLATSMLHLLNKPIRQKMGETGSKNVSALFSWKTIAKVRERDYKRALGFQNE